MNDSDFISKLRTFYRMQIKLDKECQDIHKAIDDYDTKYKSMHPSAEALKMRGDYKEKLKIVLQNMRDVDWSVSALLDEFTDQLRNEQDSA
jgi:hypothetical protein